MLERFQNISVLSVLRERPAALGNIKGDAGHPKLHGTVRFFPYRSGTVVLMQLWGLPHDPAPCAANVYAIHLHDGGACAANTDMPFSAAGGHYSPKDCPHPAHAFAGF